MRSVLVVVAAFALALTFSGIARAGAIENLAGCTSSLLAPNDDGSTGEVALPFALNFFGNSYTSLYVNNNGNVTFDHPMSTFTPFPLLTTRTPLIAPFFGDVDTRAFPASDIVRYGNTTFGGRDAFCVNWDGVGVGYFSFGTNRLNKFQLLLVDRSDVGAGDFDIIFNYDQVQWESGSASGGSNGLGGSSARVGFSNGTSASLELPGSAVNGALLDSNGASGLIHNSRDSLVLGRYVFPVRNGAAPVGGTVSGHVWQNTVGNGLGGAFVQLCSMSFCQTTQSSGAGNYVFTGVPDGTYTLTVYPPGNGLSSGGLAGVAIAGSNTLSNQDVLLTGPTPPPPGTTIVPTNGSSNGIPVIYWNNALTLMTDGCVGGTGTWTVTGTGWSTSGTMAETPGGSGHYVGTIPAFYPNHGAATVAIALSCGTNVRFDIYIDPSGVVRDQRGRPVAGATVTLYRADDSGQFVPVSDGSAIMSPANRHNPDTTDGAGRFGWDVIAGQYKVRASAPDCHAPGDESQAFVETAVLNIPPPVTDLALVLECRRDTTPPVITVPETIRAEATGAAGAVVAYQASANDDVDGAVPVHCAPASGSTFAIADTLVTCTADDAAGNHAATSFHVVVGDTTAPVVTAPANMSIDATSTAGAVATFAATAQDVVDGALAASCTPASGATFAIGDTTVTCTATDAHQNTGTASFVVHVRGASDQLGDLIGLSTGVGPGTSFADKARSARTYLSAGDPASACGALNAYLNELKAQTGKKVAPAKAAELSTAAKRIRAVIGC